MHFRLAHYDIREEIGRGGMGVVYRARDTRLGRQLAIKVLPSVLRSDPERRGRFLREARAAAALNHPNIATVYEVGEAVLEPVAVADDGEVTEVQRTTCLYIAMEYVAGQDLHDLLVGEPMPVAKSLDLAVQMADALDTAHGVGIIHRDLKPRNIRLTPEGRVKILDFGLAKVIQEDARGGSAFGGPGEVRTVEGMIVGTVPYMAPEQVEGKDVDARSDLFAFGVVLYQMLAGRVPFAGPGLVQYVRALGAGPPDPPSAHNPAVPVELDRIALRLLARKSGERYASAGAVLEGLRALLGSGAAINGVVVRDSGRRPVVSDTALGEHKKLGSSRRGSVVLGLLVIGLAGLGLWLGGRRGGESGSDVAFSRILIPMFDSSGTTPDWCAEAFAGIRSGLLQRDASLVIVNDQTAAHNSEVEVSGRCFGDSSNQRLDISVRELETGELLWVESLAPRGGIDERMRHEVVFLIDRSLETVRSFSRLPSRERRQWIEAAKRFLQGQRYIETALDGTGYRLALEELEASLQLSGERASTHALLHETLWLGWRFFSPEAAARRETEAREASQLDPEGLESRLAMIRLQDEIGDLGSAVARAETLASEEPANARVQHHLARALMKRGDRDRARDAFFTAARFRPGFWRYWNDLAAAVLRDSDFETARVALRNAISTSQANVVWPVENLGGLELDLWNLDEAEKLLISVPEVLQSASFANALGRLAFYREDWNEAVSQFSRALRNEPRNHVFAENLGDSLWKAGEEGAAKDSYRNALSAYEARLSQQGLSFDGQAGTRRPDILLAPRSQLLAKVGRCEEALADARLAEQDAGRSPDPRWDYVALAAAHALCGDSVSANALADLAVGSGLDPREVAVAVGLTRLADFQARKQRAP